MDVQRQSGGSDCGLFANANATALFGGLDPYLQNFEQSKMREHLKKCLFRNKLEWFPKSGRRRLGQHRFVATKPNGCASAALLGAEYITSLTSLVT